MGGTSTTSQTQWTAIEPSAIRRRSRMTVEKETPNLADKISKRSDLIPQSITQVAILNARVQPIRLHRCCLAAGR
jgi:hypothetical protein